MIEPGQAEVAAIQSEPPFDGAQEVALLRDAGAPSLDPLRFHYLEVLSGRAQLQQGPVKRILEEKLARLVADFRCQLTQVQDSAESALEHQTGAVEFPASKGECLADLIRSLSAVDLANGSPAPQQTDAPRVELKSVRLFRSTWSKLSADKQLNAALDRAPKNAGPINSHMLVLRSLALMREISPDYLNRFISYADTLVHLEQSEKTPSATPKAKTEGEGGHKPKAPRARAKKP
jgi:hypothetical protein